MCACGYPGTEGVAVNKGDIITYENHLDNKIFFAAVKEDEGELLTNGGRVLGVTATSETLQQARKKAYAGVTKLILKECSIETTSPLIKIALFASGTGSNVANLLAHAQKRENLTA